MGVGKRQAEVRAMRGKMWSPGRPPVGRREHRERFWEGIAGGLSSEHAGVLAGCLACGWFALVPREWRDGPVRFRLGVGALFVLC